MNKLIDELIKSGYLHSNNVIEAFLKIPREKFVSIDLRQMADANIPLPIGKGQTISQPLTVAFMLELLDVKNGQHVLDVGSGSGWTTALLAYLVGDNGRITAIEINKELCDQGKNNVAKFNFIKKGIAEFYCQSAESGYERNAPYDRILVSASAHKVPEAFKQQLTIGGKIVIPIKNEIWCVEKKAKNIFKTKKFPGFVFVPFIELG